MADNNNPDIYPFIITYADGDATKSLSASFGPEGIVGMRTAAAAVRTLSKLPGMNEPFSSILRERDLLSVSANVADDQVQYLQETSDLIANPEATLTDVYDAFVTETSSPIDELDWMNAFGEDLPPYVLVTDDAITHSRDDQPADAALQRKDLATDLLSFSSKDGRRTVIVKNMWGVDFEVGFLYLINLMYSVYNRNFTTRLTKPVIYNVKLNRPLDKNGFISSNDLSVNAERTTRLQY